MRRTHQTSTHAALRWLWALAAGLVLLLPAVAEAAAGAGDRPEGVTHKTVGSSGGSSSGGSRGSTSSRGSSSGGKVSSVRSSSASSSSSSSSGSSSSAGKVQSIRSHQGSSSGSSSGGSSGSSGGGGSYHGGYHGGHGHHHYSRPYYHSSLYFGFGYPYYYAYWPYLYPYYPYPHARRPYYVEDDALGALDLNVKPKETQVFVNGRFVGTAGQLDGLPRYLWLEQGTYELIFFNQGYQTEVREYEIHPDLVIDVKLRMSSGESVPVEQLSRRLSEPEPAPAKTEVEVQQAWRQPPPAERPPPASAPGAVDARQSPATVRLNVEPADASIYLDGRLVGTSRDLASGLLVEPGQHRVEIVHPSFLPRTLPFEVGASENVQLDIRLEPKPAGSA